MNCSLRASLLQTDAKLARLSKGCIRGEHRAVFRAYCHLTTIPLHQPKVLEASERPRTPASAESVAGKRMLRCPRQAKNEPLVRESRMTPLTQEHGLPDDLDSDFLLP